MAFLDLIDLKKIRRALLYVLCVIVTLGLQDAFFSRVELLGVRALFVPVIVVAIGLFEGGVWGCVFGLVTGYFCDMSFSANTALFLVLFAVFGFLAGFLAEFLVNRRFLSYAILSALALFITPMCQIVPLWIFNGTPLSQLMPTVCLQALWSLPFMIPAYFAVKAIAAREKEV
ncbi:MAG: hypothetical protein ACI4PC_00900 [Oscillospiraceae bacterium]